jgi:hypothetical protein
VNPARDTILYGRTGYTIPFRELYIDDDAISGYMSAMREEFDQRGIDYCAIGDEKSMSYANKIKIVNSLVILND